MTHRAPSFEGFKPSSPDSSRTKKANRKTNTAHELELQRALRKLGLKFDTHRADLPGNPDIVFPDQKLVVFCDGDFWHGRNWQRLRLELMRRANASYWVAKIGANRNRDVRTRRALLALGWSVVRLWETEIRRDPLLAASLLRERLEVFRRSRSGIPTELRHALRPAPRGKAARKIPPAS